MPWLDGGGYAMGGCGWGYIGAACCHGAMGRQEETDKARANQTASFMAVGNREISLNRFIFRITA